MQASNNSNQNNLVNRNRKSFSALLAENSGSQLEIRNDGNGKPYFLLGDTVGYVSPQAFDVINDSSLSNAEVIAKLQYAESKFASLPDSDPETGASNWVPTLMVVGNRKPALRTFCASDLMD